MFPSQFFFEIAIFSTTQLHPGDKLASQISRLSSSPWRDEGHVMGPRRHRPLFPDLRPWISESGLKILLVRRDDLSNNLF